MSNINPNCDGSHCRENGPVRVYPLGAGGNLILCHACFAHENRYRYNRGVETKRPHDWPQVNWATAKPYPETETGKWRVVVLASKEGSIGLKYCERRVYEVDAMTQEIAQDKARNLAYAEGLEHTHIPKCEAI